jgi:hypothetical protein
MEWKVLIYIAARRVRNESRCASIGVSPKSHARQLRPRSGIGLLRLQNKKFYRDRVSMANCNHAIPVACFSTRYRLINRLPAIRSKKTFWQNPEGCYKGFIDQHHRTSVKLGIRSPSSHSFTRQDKAGKAEETCIGHKNPLGPKKRSYGDGR